MECGKSQTRLFSALVPKTEEQIKISEKQKPSKDDSDTRI